MRKDMVSSALFGTMEVDKCAENKFMDKGDWATDRPAVKGEADSLRKETKQLPSWRLGKTLHLHQESSDERSGRQHCLEGAHLV